MNANQKARVAPGLQTPNRYLYLFPCSLHCFKTCEVFELIDYYISICPKCFSSFILTRALTTKIMLN